MTQNYNAAVAWAVASKRAANFFALQREASSAGTDADGGALGSLGFEQLRDFTVGVQVVGAAQQEEFFTADDPVHEDAKREVASGSVPTGETGELPA